MSIQLTRNCHFGNFCPLHQHSFIKYNGLEIFFNNLNQFKIKNLNEFNPTKQSLQVAEVKISYHNQSKVSDYPKKINNSKDAELILRNNWSDDMELLEEFMPNS
ncbi:MAG: hypothetical protein IPK88_16780 [Saprospiraceae bacterium]|nr:hypothetical protein [Candidatus Defluviibacterium haderslevense]